MTIVATVENGVIRLPEGIHLPDGTRVSLDVPLSSAAAANGWPPGYFEATSSALAGERFERPDQGEFEERTEW